MRLNLNNAYIAGLFDGEGWVTCAFRSKSRAQRPSATIYIQMGIGLTNYKILEALQKKFGGSIGNTRQRKITDKPYWLWVLSTKQIEKFIIAIEPYCIEKRLQIKLAKKFRKTIQIKSRCRLSPKILNYRIKLRNELHQLNGGKCKRWKKHNPDK